VVASKEIYNFTLHEEEREEIKEALEKLTKEFDIVSLTTKEDQIQDRGSQITLSAIGRNAPLEIKKQYDPDESKRKKWIVFLKTVLDGSKYEMNIAGTTSIDITPKGLDKEWGIKRFCKHYGISLNSILFFGDKIYPGGNDYPASRIVDCISVNSPKDTLKELRKLKELKKIKDEIKL